ncbi:MAG: hypothetical protein CL947_04140 [Epsilonproteobacteria bacterium]|nr:hypothetical protein [Campylobacterota bacterium]
MRQPLWLINIILLVILCVSELTLLLLHTVIPRKFSIQPSAVQLQEKQQGLDVNIQKIYGVNDIFGTYVPEVPTVAPGINDDKIPPIPVEPAPIPLSIPIEKSPVFIAPLQATLKGVIYLHDNIERSVAIVQFKDSKSEQNYRVGEMIQDAQVLKILPNRVIVVRSNGQQETLYLRDKDAKKDLAYDEQSSLESLNIVAQNNKYFIPLESFVKAVKSLGDFIDMLDLTTVYKKGKSIGCRVGRTVKNSLGSKLGFSSDDIIVQVDGIKLTDLDSRVKIYDHVITKKIGDQIEVKVNRSGDMVEMQFVLSDHDKMHQNQTKNNTQQGPQGKISLDDQEYKKKILEQRVKLAPTAHQIQMDEQRKLIEARKKNILSNGYISKRQ